MSEPVTLSRLVHRMIDDRTGGRVLGLSVAIAQVTIVVSGRTRTFCQKQLALAAMVEAIKAESLKLIDNIDVD
jgi:hypothetical protein